jgi:hypothetical protein
MPPARERLIGQHGKTWRLRPDNGLANGRRKQLLVCLRRLQHKAARFPEEFSVVSVTIAF